MEVTKNMSSSRLFLLLTLFYSLPFFFLSSMHSEEGLPNYC